MELPEQFKIANMPYVVIRKGLVKEDNISMYGTHSDILGEIQIADNIEADNEIIKLKDNQILNTFWHEVFHAFQFFYNNEQDESLAQTFANFMCELLESSNFQFVPKK